jgi:acetyl-CoA carboxylase biotin carboxyl carrier protein
MDLKKIKEIVELVKSEGLSEFSYEDKNEKIKLAFNDKQVLVQGVVDQTQANPNVAIGLSPSAPPISANPVQNKTASDPNIKEITAPFVGTFYSSPAPGEPTFVKVGDRVSKGKTLCILEAMKIMNEIDSDFEGEIVEIVVENESFVEFGQTLFRIKTK